MKAVDANGLTPENVVLLAGRRERHGHVRAVAAILPVITSCEPLGVETHGESARHEPIVSSAKLRAAPALEVIGGGKLVPTPTRTHEPVTATAEISAALEIAVMSIGVWLVVVIGFATIVVSSQGVQHEMRAFDIDSSFGAVSQRRIACRHKRGAEGNVGMRKGLGNQLGVTGLSEGNGAADHNEKE